MKLLGLLRHAKSSWDTPALDDFDRPLNERGRAAAARMAEEYRKLELGYELALVSPARRAADTFGRVRDSLGADLIARPTPRLYAASLGDLLAILAETSPSIERLLVVGHNPGLHQLARRLTGDDGSPQRKALAAKLPTGSLVEISLPIQSWAEAAAARGDLVRFLRPRVLD